MGRLVRADRASVRPRLLLLALSALIIVVGVGGCSIRGNSPKPQVHRYILGPASNAILTADRPSIDLGAVTGLTPFRDTEIAYQTTPYRLDTYTFHRWSAPPIEQVTERIGVLLQPPPSGPKSSLPSMLLNSHIESFQEVDEGEHVTGLVSINFCLVPKRQSSKVLWCQTISHQTSASANTREAAVVAITTSFNSVADDLVAELNRQFASMPEPPEANDPAPRKPFKIPGQ